MESDKSDQKGRSAAREAQLAQALRANLRRRKAVTKPERSGGRPENQDAD